MGLAFDDNVLDIERRELRRADRVVAVPPQVFDLIAYLVQNRERVVSKDDLLEHVWRGRIVSESAMTTAINAARKAIGDSGDAQRLIRTVHRKGLRFVGEVVALGELAPSTDKPPVAATAGETPVPQPEPARPALALPDKPSIAVLPFANLSGDPEQQYFADGMVEEITTALSHIRWLFVIARNSTQAYKGRVVDVRQVGRELGVRYVLEGSVRRSADRVRITAQLIEAESGSHVWADRYDGTSGDVFALQDRIAETVAAIMEPTIQKVEIARTRRKPPTSLDAYEHYLQGLALTDVYTRDSTQAILDHCLRAVALDPYLAPAYALAARAHIQFKAQGWIDYQAQQAKTVLDLVELGLRADRLDPLMLAYAGHCFAWFGGDLPKGIAYIDEALALNPNLAHAYLQSGILRTRAGLLDKAIEHLGRAHRLNPHDTRSYAVFAAMGNACVMRGEAETAREWARRAVEQNPNYGPAWRSLAAAAGALGRDAEALSAAKRLLAIDPQFSISVYLRRYPMTAPPEARDRYLDGLRHAGIPE